jgi:hypothetical protein
VAASARQRTTGQWEAIRVAAGTRVFTSLYQGRPSPDSGNVWRRPWWRRYESMLWSQHPTDPQAYLVHGMDEIIQSWDMAFKDTKSSDFVVGRCGPAAARGLPPRQDPQAPVVHRHRHRGHGDDAEVAAGQAKLVEDKANGTAVISTLKSKIPGLIPVNPTDSKYGRATAVSPFIEAGNVFLPADSIALPGC